MSVYANNVQQLVEIRESLFSPPDRKILVDFSIATSSYLNQAIQLRIRALKANPLYGTSGDDFKIELVVLSLSVSRVIHFIRCDNDRRVLKITMTNLHGHFDVWFENLQDEAVMCGVAR